ncbi:protein wingless isoform X1 [Hydra vulgaris]|uniref:Protein Wnt n=1 Tax=Hydra vulgaris TaxID=6087 RepID=A0ABM4BYR6_HYDVU
MISLHAAILLFLCLVYVENHCIRGERQHKASCLNFPYFMRQQTPLSYSTQPANFTFNNALTSELLYNASRIATDACEQQFQHQQWNCSLSTFNKLTKRASRETSFLFAIYSAGLAHSIAAACSRGLIENCKCHSTNNKIYRMTEREVIYEDASCASNSIAFGITESRKMLHNDKENDLKWRINEHNKEAGRKMLNSNVLNRQVSCQCHGASGACAIKKCAQQIPFFKAIGQQIMLKYNNAIQVQSDNNVFSSKLIPYHLENLQEITENDLVYNQPSPNFCELDKHSGSLGTRGRICSANSTGSDSCGKLCCNRGYSEKTTFITVSCRCRFAYCCDVKCESCQKKVVTQFCN